MKANSAKQFKVLEQDNQRLKRAVGDLTLDKPILREALDHLNLMKLIRPSQGRLAVAHVPQTLGEEVS